MTTSSRHFVAYFTRNGVWRSCDVTELGTYNTVQAAMQAGQQHLSQDVTGGSCGPGRLAWKRLPQGLTARTVSGRYDVREGELALAARTT